MASDAKYFLRLFLLSRLGKSHLSAAGSHDIHVLLGQKGTGCELLALFCYECYAEVKRALCSPR
jgi:hypothetical protein